jgi:Domain of unknown function (DUF6265)
MRQLKWMIAGLAMVAGGVAADPAPSPMPSWMTGAWEMREGDRWGDEYWTPARAGMMIGAARVGKGDKLLEWEHTRITREADGSLVYWAMPKGVPATKFVASAVTATSVTFDNPGHDYPQRVRYWREGPLLKAEISKIDGSDAFRFAYKPIG